MNRPIAIANSDPVKRVLELSAAAHAAGPFSKEAHAFRNFVDECLSAARTVDSPVTAKIWIGCDPKTRLPGWRTEEDSQAGGFERYSSQGGGTSLRRHLDSIFDHVNFHHEFWMKKLEEYLSPKCRTQSGARIWVDEQYVWRGMNSPVDLSKGGRADTLGYGGSPWHVEFFDGTRFTSNDVWCGGIVPATFRNLMKPNGKSVRSAE
jgi:hypothetical protein